ncbi:MAG: MFS transporter [Hespellia sp.]|nr:MFS transporter [Hespellia sp.]
MERNYPTGIKFRIFQAAVLSLSMLLASVSVAGCLLGDLAQEFPNASPALLQSFVTFPTIGGMIANIIGGASAAKIGKKNLCLVGIALCFIGGFSPMLIPSLIGKIVVRVLAGIGVGLIQPLSASLIVDCFEGTVANVMMGFQSSMVGLGASIFSYTMAGIMVYDWHYAYCAYLYAAAILILVLFGIPAFVNDLGREEKKPAADAVKTTKVKSKLPMACYIGAICQLLFGLGYGALDNCTSLAGVEVGITTVQAAAIASFGGIAALIGGLVFGLVKGKIGYNVGWLSLILNILGFVIMGTTDTVAMWYVGITIAKVGFCWWMPYINFLVNDGTNESNSALATSLAFVGNSLGAFVFGYVFAFIGGLAGGLTQHQGYLYGGIWMGIALVLITFNHVKNYKHYVEIA